MKVVSDKLNCRASACMVWESKAAPFSNTHSGLPSSALAVNDQIDDAEPIARPW